MAQTKAGLREWIRDHDHKWLFVVVYLGLAVVLSIFVSLFWLVMVGGLHLALEIVRQAYYRQGSWNVVAHALWEIKLDIALIILALTLVLYIEVVMGVLGLQSAGRAAAVSRAGARVGARFAAWERNLRAALLTVDEVARIAHAGITFGRRARARRKGQPTPPPGPAASSIEPGAGPAWSGRWSLGDRLAMGLLAFGVLLLAAAPFMTPYDWAGAMQVLAHELRPFPS